MKRLPSFGRHERAAFSSAGSRPTTPANVLHRAGASWALALGLVSHVVADPLAYALAMARDMARRSATGIAAAKCIVHAAQDAAIEDALTIEQQEVNDRLGSDEVREVLRAYAKSGADLRKPIQIRRETNGEL